MCNNAPFPCLARIFFQTRPIQNPIPKKHFKKKQNKTKQKQKQKKKKLQKHLKNTSNFGGRVQ